MVVLRVTQKVLKTLPASAADEGVSDTALGDWYVNRITVDRQPLLLLVSSASRLSLLARARDVKDLPKRIAGMVATRLLRLSVNERLIQAEVEAMSTVLVGRTRDRSVTGQMVDFASLIPSYVPVGGVKDRAMLGYAEDKLGDTPCLCGRAVGETIWPAQESVRLLTLRWTEQNTER